MECFLKSLPDGLMSNGEKTDKVRILKKPYVFTVGLHLGLVDKVRAKLAPPNRVLEASWTLF